jgi:hypothetical protein
MIPISPACASLSGFADWLATGTRVILAMLLALPIRCHSANSLTRPKSYAIGKTASRV